MPRRWVETTAERVGFWREHEKVSPPVPTYKGGVRASMTDHADILVYRAGTSLRWSDQKIYGRMSRNL